MKKFLYILFLMSSSGLLEAQDSLGNSLRTFLRNGQVNGKTRIYFMETNNEFPLSDYHGLGIGAGIGYTTPTFKGFSAAMSGYFVLNAYSSDFNQLDSVTQNPNRYELGLFDVTDPGNTSNLYRLENLWIRYKKDEVDLHYGQYVPDYEFINPQDGRMSPTMVRGFDGKWNKGNSLVNLAFIHAISPRSTVKWYAVEETFGIYPTGRSKDGSSSDYTGNIQSAGILLAEISQRLKPNLSLKLGSMTVMNVFQTWTVNLDYKKAGWGIKLLTIQQQALNKNTNNTYYDESDGALIFSGRMEKNFKKWNTNINYTRIADKGRFLMPREWGREPLYTFLPRERNEGLANVHAFSFQVQNKVNEHLSGFIGAGRYLLPEAADATRNKYAIPSYNQLNLMLDYHFNNFLEGASFKALYVRKQAFDNHLENPKFVFNKVNLGLVNLIFNYTF